MKFVCTIFSIIFAFSSAKILSHMKSDKIAYCLYEHSDTIEIICFDRSSENTILSNTTKAECHNHDHYEKKRY